MKPHVARRRFGQHFLEPAWVTKVVKAVDAKPDESVLEIGPGRAAITRPLAEQCGRLLAVEVDRDLAAELEATKPASALRAPPKAPRRSTGMTFDTRNEKVTLCMPVKKP